MFSHRYTTRENRLSHPIACRPEIGAVASNMNKWNTIVQTEDLSRRRHRYLEGDKKSIHNPVLVPFDQERDDAIAELDSVIDSYHSKHSNRQKRKQLSNEQSILSQEVQDRKTMERNGGTWPKARMG